MFKKGNLSFAGNIGVLFELKQRHNLQTVQETYNLLEKTDMDTIFEVLCLCYNKANSTQLTIDEFGKLLESENLGFINAIDLYKGVVEDILFHGLTPEEIEQRKNEMLNLKK